MPPNAANIVQMEGLGGGVGGGGVGGGGVGGTIPVGGICIYIQLIYTLGYKLP